MVKKYIILNLDDMKTILQYLQTNDKTKNIINRFKNEDGGNIQEIANLLKKLDTCHACQVEGQERNCESLIARKIGRRLNRLIFRADGFLIE